MSEWNTLAKARQDFADMLDGLSDEQLNAQSLCDEWRVVDVGGHLVSLLETSSVALVKGMAKNRNDPDTWMAKMGIEFGDKGAPFLAKSLRENAFKKLRPFSEASMVSDVAVHILDVRRPLGLTDALDPEVLAMALEFGVGEYAKKDKPAIRFVASDMDWSAGTGPEVRGTGEALLQALNDRDVADELEGDGVELLG